MAFKMRSGNKVSFKSMGSSPMKQSINPDDLNMEKERIKEKVKEGYDNPADTPSNVEIPKSETYTPPEKEKARVMTEQESNEAANKTAEADAARAKRKQDALDLDNKRSREGREAMVEYDEMLKNKAKAKTEADAKKTKAEADAKAEAEKLARNTSERNTSKKNTRTTPTDEVSTDDRTGRVKTKQEIKQDYKTQKLIDRGADTKGGGRRTKQERLDAKRSKLNAQQRRARQLEDVGRGEKTFGWKNFGKSMLDGRGLRGSISDGIGTGESKSKQIQRKSDKLEGKQDRVDERRSQGKTSILAKATKELLKKTKKKNK